MAEALCVYIIHDANGRAYIGQTNDLARRLSQHNTGQGSAFTRAHRTSNWYVAWSQRVTDRAEARCIERYLTIKAALRLAMPIRAAQWAPLVHVDHERRKRKFRIDGDDTPRTTEGMVWKDGAWLRRGTGHFYSADPWAPAQLRAWKAKHVQPIDQPIPAHLKARLDALTKRAESLGLKLQGTDSALLRALTLTRERQRVVLRRTDDPDAIETALDIYEGWPNRDYAAHPLKADEKPREGTPDSSAEPPPGRAPRDMSEQQLALILLALQHLPKLLPRNQSTNEALAGLCFTTRAQIERELDQRRASAG